MYRVLDVYIDSDGEFSNNRLTIWEDRSILSQ